MEKKKILICSHERSGTSFLINTIGGNFPEYLPERDGDTNLRVDLDGAGYNFADPEEMLNFLNDSRFKDIPIRNQFKSHHHFEYFRPIWDEVIDQYRVFYIYRDGRDVLTSYWRHVRKQGHHWGPVTFQIGQFIRAAPVGAACRYHGPRIPGNMAERWNDHIVSWMEPRIPNVQYIAYEDMLEHFDNVVERIGGFLGCSSPDTPVRPGLAGVHPWRGVAGNWREFFDESDESFFEEYCRDAMQLIGRGYPANARAG